MINIVDYGVVSGSAVNVIQNTNNLYNAINAAINKQDNLYVPAGKYYINPITIAPSSYSQQIGIVGDGKRTSVFVRGSTTNNSLPLIQIGSNTSSIFYSNSDFKDFGINAGSNVNGPAMRCYDLVRSTLKSLDLKGGTDSLQMYGGISTKIKETTLSGSKKGLSLLKFNSLAGGGYPNLITFSEGEIVENSEWGIMYADGRMLIIEKSDIEGNGLTPYSAQGGIYVSPNVGSEVISTTPQSKTLVIDKCWFEANKGTGDIVIDGGISSIENSLFFSNNSENYHDILVGGGRYFVDRCNSSFSKSANVFETANVLSGNSVTNSKFATMNINSQKTYTHNNT